MEQEAAYGRYAPRIATTSGVDQAKANPVGNDLFSDAPAEGSQYGGGGLPQHLERQRQLAIERSRQRLSGSLGLPGAAAAVTPASAGSLRGRAAPSYSAPRGIDPLDNVASVFDRESYLTASTSTRGGAGAAAGSAAGSSSGSGPLTTLGRGSELARGTSGGGDRDSRGPGAGAAGGALAEAVRERERRATAASEAEHAALADTAGSARSMEDPQAPARAGTLSSAAPRPDARVTAAERELSQLGLNGTYDPSWEASGGSGGAAPGARPTQAGRPAQRGREPSLAGQGFLGATSPGMARDVASLAAPPASGAAANSTNSSTSEPPSYNGAGAPAGRGGDWLEHDAMLVAPLNIPGGQPAGGRGTDGAAGAPLDLGDMRRFLTSPAPRSAGVVQCYIEREGGGLLSRFRTVYSLYLSSGDRFLLTAQKRTKNKTSNYVLSVDKRDLNRDSDSYIGKLRANFVGTEYTVFDEGDSPGKAREGADERLRQELAVATYASNVLGARGPRKMRVAVPRIQADGSRTRFQPTSDEEGMMEMFKAGHTQDMSLLINKPPKWNDTASAYVLNFGGRVTMASVKNFQLVAPEDHETVVLQFGRAGKDSFTMDFQWPLSPLQAFGIALSSFDYKLACE